MLFSFLIAQNRTDIKDTCNTINSAIWYTNVERLVRHRFVWRLSFKLFVFHVIVGGSTGCLTYVCYIIMGYSAILTFCWAFFTIINLGKCVNWPHTGEVIPLWGRNGLQGMFYWDWGDAWGLFEQNKIEPFWSGIKRWEKKFERSLFFNTRKTCFIYFKYRSKVDSLVNSESRVNIWIKYSERNMKLGIDRIKKCSAKYLFFYQTKA